MLKQVAALESRIFPDPWSFSILESMCASSTENIYVATDETDEIVAYCCTQSVLDEGEILRIAVAHSMRRKGIGNILLSEVINRMKNNGCKTIFLEVRCENRPAISLYESCGFIKISERKDYYAKGEHAAIFKLQLD